MGLPSSSQAPPTTTPPTHPTPLLQVQILVRKVRNKAAGTIGDCVLEYERVNGRYIDPDSPGGAPRTAQRVDFNELARQEELARVRAEEAAAAAEAAAGSTGGGASPLQARPAAPAAAAAGAAVQDVAVAVGGTRGYSTAAVAGASSASSAAAPRQQAASAAERELERAMARDLEGGAQPPAMFVHRDGTVSSNPEQDDAEVGSWMDSL